MINIRKFLQGIGLIPTTSSTIDTKGEMEVLDSNGKLNYHNGTSASPVVTEAHSASLTNKTIDADQNTISNIENADIKAGAAIDAAKIANGSVSNTEFQYLDGVTSAIQTQIDSKASSTALNNHITNPTGAHAASAVSNTPSGNLAATDVQGALNELQSDVDTRALNSALTSHITNTTGAHAASAVSNTPSGNLAAINVQSALNELQSDVDTRALNSDLTTHTSASSGVHGATGSVVGTSDSQTLTNKTINATNNSISNISNAEIKVGAAIDAAKIANGTVSNTEFQYLDGVTSAIQTQIDSKASASTVSSHISSSTGVHGVTGSVVGTSDSQTLTNKTLTSPIVDVLVMDDQASTPSAPSVGYIKTYFKTDGKLYKLDSSAVESEVSASSNATSSKIIQASHGLVIGDVVRYNGIAYVKAQADADTNAEVYGMVSEVIDINTFRLVTEGYVSGLSGLLAGTTYYLSPLTAGALVAIEPFSGGQVSKPVFISDSTSSGYVIQSRGILVGPVSTPRLVMSDYALTSGFTPNNFGTVTNNTFYSRRIGDSLEVSGSFTSGTSVGSPASISLPSGYLIDSTKLSATTGTILGTFISPTAALATIYGNNNAFVIFYDGSDTSKVYISYQVTTGNYLKSNANNVAGSGTTVDFRFTIPIAGWTATSSGQVSAPRSEIAVDSGNGQGSTNTKIRRFSNVRKNVGSDITYADSAADGGSFTINTSGVYTISYNDGTSLSACDIGISVNTSAGSTSINGLPYSSGFRATTTAANAGYVGFCSWTGNLSAGDVVRAHNGSTTSNFTDSRCSFTITKVSN